MTKEPETLKLEEALDELRRLHERNQVVEDHLENLRDAILKLLLNPSDRNKVYARAVYVEAIEI